MKGRTANTSHSDNRAADASLTAGLTLETQAGGRGVRVALIRWLSFKMKKLIIVYSLIPLCFLQMSCQRNWGKYVHKGNYCNGFEKVKAKVIIQIRKDSSYLITTTKKSTYTNWKKETKFENGIWQVEKDTLMMESPLLSQTLYLIENKYLCNRLELDQIKRLDKDIIRFRLKTSVYKKPLL